MSDAAPQFSMRSVALAALLPTLLFSIGEGAIIPLIPLVAHDLGASLALAGLLGALVMVGTVVGDIPSGAIVARIGERTAMIWAALLSVIAVLICLAAPNALVLGIGVFIVGLATAVFGLARHAFLTSYVPIQYRARALSTLGGVFRAGFFVGPFLSAGVIHLTGGTQAVFWVFIVCCLAATAVLLLLPDPASTFGAPQGRPGTAGADGLFRTLRANRGVLLRLGTGVGLVGAMRATRLVIMPLWAVSIGIGQADTALIIGIAGAVDFALFYVSGQIMDKHGRLWSALPSMLGLGSGLLVLAFTHDLPSNVAWFIAVAMFLSLANGIGSGIMMTLGADLAPRSNPAPFLGAWRFAGDLGSAVAPLAVAGITAIATLALASGVAGVAGLFGAGILARYIPRYLPRTAKRPAEHPAKPAASK
ncbi:MFS transporter [Microterricola viridarii]|uniref:Predicted arabinose efflux permease, MFS family n=1 Tax=Microterricola viridarii TaxID=412690 RepID=A0A1H1S2T2_9MICO|nr:MFS transporter [Microterricola viridarii]SDS42301.1 Predicted arabinose efflux permease, MFS family [Microterricola viridarii]